MLQGYGDTNYNEAKPLLERGADVNAKGGMYGNALKAASRTENIGISGPSILKVIIDRGAHANVEGVSLGQRCKQLAREYVKKGW